MRIISHFAEDGTKAQICLVCWSMNVQTSSRDIQLRGRRLRTKSRPSEPDKPRALPAPPCPRRAHLASCRSNTLFRRRQEAVIQASTHNESELMVILKGKKFGSWSIVSHCSNVSVSFSEIEGNVYF